MNPWIAWLLGVATLPAAWLVTRAAFWLFDSTNSWITCRGCGWRTHSRWDRLKRHEVRRHWRRAHGRRP